MTTTIKLITVQNISQYMPIQLDTRQIKAEVKAWTWYW